MNQTLLKIWIPLLALPWALSAALTCQAQAPANIQIRTIQGLTQRRLYDLAVSHATHVLDESQTAGAHPVDVVVALIDTLSQKAYQSRDSQDWQVARDIAADWELRSTSPRRILISVQSALIDQLQVEKWVRELETDTAQAGSRERAQAAISGLVMRLNALQTETRSLLNRRPSPREEADWFSPNELLTLRYNLEYQQTRALMHRAALYGPDEELNRKDVLLQVQQQLNSVLQSVRPDQSMWWTVQADRLAIERTLGDFREAEKIMAGLPTDQGSLRDRHRVQAEWIRTLCRQRRFDEAVAVAGKGPLASESPKLDLARVELFVAMASHSPDPTWQQRALELTSDVEAIHGGYWGRLANLAVVGTINENPVASSNLDLLIRVADEAQRRKQWPEALQALDAAYAQATQSGRTDVAWKLGFRAASIEQTKGDHAAAASRFADLATRHADFPEAHAGSLMACWNLTRIMKGDPEKFQQYEAQLTKLIATWPLSPSADQARIWLAAIRQSQQNGPAAIGLLLDVNAASPIFGKALQDLRVATRELMSATSLSEESKSNIRSALMVRLRPLVEVPSSGMPDNWKETRARVVLQLVELQTLFGTQPDLDLSPRWQEVVEHPNLPADIQPLVSALAFIRSGRPLRWGDTSQEKADQLQLMLEGLSPDPAAADRLEKSRRLCAASEQFANQIRQLPAPLRRKWSDATIDALLVTSQTVQAIALAADLAKQYPKQAAAQLRLAELLNLRASETAEDLSAALKQWRRIASLSRKHSDHWYAAKYQVARLLAQQGNNTEALKLLNFIHAVPPGWREAPNASAFDDLWRSLGGR